MSDRNPTEFPSGAGWPAWAKRTNGHFKTIYASLEKLLELRDKDVSARNSNAEELSDALQRISALETEVRGLRDQIALSNRVAALEARRK